MMVEMGTLLEAYIGVLGEIIFLIEIGNLDAYLRVNGSCG